MPLSTRYFGIFFGPEGGLGQQDFGPRGEGGLGQQGLGRKVVWKNPDYNPPTELRHKSLIYLERKARKIRPAMQYLEADDLLSAIPLNHKIS